MRRIVTNTTIIVFIIIIGLIASVWINLVWPNVLRDTVTLAGIQKQMDALQMNVDAYQEENRRAVGNLFVRTTEIANIAEDVDSMLARQIMELEQKNANKIPNIEATVPKVMPGVVNIMCPQWQGSGFVAGPRLIATARHVVEDVTDFTITTNDGHKIRATRAISFKKHDVGFVWIDDLHCVDEKCEYKYPCGFSILRGTHEAKLSVLELGSIKECNLGQPVFAIGSPYGKANFNHLSSGIISSLDRSWNELGENYGWEVGWITTVAGHPGSSGCPIFTLDGKVRGVLVGGLSPVLVIAMPVDLFLDHMDEITTMFEMDKFKKEQKTEVISTPQTSKDEVE